MLQQQINYLNYKELQRHNLVQEAQEWAKVTLERLKLEETKRHNLTMEQLEQRKLAETIRHNLVSEKQQDIRNGIELYLAKTREGELLLKQFIEPQKLEIDRIKAGASVTQARAAASQAATAAYLSTFKSDEVQIASRRAEGAYKSGTASLLRAQQQGVDTANKQSKDWRAKQKDIEQKQQELDLRKREQDLQLSRNLVQGATDTLKNVGPESVLGPPTYSKTQQVPGQLRLPVD